MHLGGQCESEDDGVRMVVLKWLSEQVADFYEDGIQKPII